jgi:hypothetical protein
MVAGNDIISAVDYNSIRTTVRGALQTLYGQTPSSAEVDGFQSVGLAADSALSSQMLNLFLDMQRAYVHQTGNLNATISVPLQNHVIGANASDLFNTNTGAKTTTANSSEMGLNDFIAVANDIANFSGAFPSGNFSLSAQNTSSTRLTQWGGTGQVQSIYHIFEADFPSNAEMSAYFAAGGTVRITTSLTGGTTAKAAEWASMISAMGTITFGLDATNASSGTSSGGYSTLGTSYSTVFQKTGGGAYSVNDFTLEAKADFTTSTIRFRYSMNDNYVTNPVITNPDITVDGTMASTVNAYHPDSAFNYDGDVETAVYIDPPTLSNDFLLSQNPATPPS